MKLVLAIAAVGLLAAPAFADDVNVRAGKLPNETRAGKVQVDIVCVVDDQALMKDCHVADANKVSTPETRTAIASVEGRSHVAGHYAAGQNVKLTVTLNEQRPSTPFMLIR